jgi:hypothetical protein
MTVSPEPFVAAIITGTVPGVGRPRLSSTRHEVSGSRHSTLEAEGDDDTADARVLDGDRRTSATGVPLREPMGQLDLGTPTDYPCPAEWRARLRDV